VTCAVRLATPADLPAATRLALALVHQHHGYDPARFALFEEMERGYAAFLAAELRNPGAVVLVATLDGVEDGAVMGYAFGRMEERNYAALLDAHGALHDLYVEEAARGRGVASALVSAMLDRLRSLGASRVVLSTAHQNQAAQRLFAKLGFRPTLVEMTKELGSTNR
jgi:ribosomal protein S18 acetylase RimI-like enzyme